MNKIINTILIVLSLAFAAFASNSLGLHGRGDYVSFASTTSTGGTTTISFCSDVKFADGSAGYAMGNGDANDIRINQNKVEAIFYNGAATIVLTSPTTGNDLTWHFVCGVRSGGSYKLYDNAVNVASFTDTANPSSTYTHKIQTIGQRATNSDFYKGLERRAALWSKALSGAEITTIYNGGTFTPLTAQTGLVAAYNLQEGSGTAITDSSGNNKSGVLQNPNSIYTNWFDGDRATNTNFYASPTGLVSNTGVDNTHTWPLDYALSHPPGMIPGDTLILKNGSTFLPTSGLVSFLTGTAAKPIVVKTESAIGTFPNTVKINGVSILSSGSILSIYGKYATYNDLEVYISVPQRLSAQSGSAPTDIYTLAGIDIKGAEITLQYPHVHDTSANGITAFDPAGNVTVNGAISYNNGWTGPDRDHGHGFYSHNNNPLVTLHWNNTTTFNNYYYNFQQYTSQYEYDSYNQIWSVMNSTGRPLGIVGASPKHNFSLTDYNGYNSGIEWGYGDEDNFDGTLSNLTISAGAPLQARSWRTLSLTDSVLVTDENGRANQITETVGNTLGTINFARNTYWAGINPYLPQSFVRYNANGSLDSYHTFASWQGMGLDTTSTFHSGSGNDKPAANVIKYYPDALTPGRGTLVVWNWLLSSSVTINLSSYGFQDGQTYKIYNLHKPGTVFTTGTYSASSPTRSLSTVSNGVTLRLSDTASTPGATLPNFGMFLIVPDPFVPPVGAPNSVTAVTSVRASNTQINVSWTLPVSGSAPTSVKVQKRLAGLTSWTTVTLAGDATSYQDSGLTPGVVMEYQVYTENGSGTSAVSSIVSAIATGCFVLRGTCPTIQ